MSKHDSSAIQNTCRQLDTIAESAVIAGSVAGAAHHAAYILRELACALGDGSYPINRERLDATLALVAGQKKEAA